jgi:hypothetical protein
MTDMARVSVLQRNLDPIQWRSRRSIDVIRDYGRRPVSTEEHEEHFALEHAGFQIDDLIPSAIQKLLGSSTATPICCPE